MVTCEGGGVHQETVLNVRDVGSEAWIKRRGRVWRSPHSGTCIPPEALATAPSLDRLNLTHLMMTMNSDCSQGTDEATLNTRVIAGSQAG